MNHHVLAGSFCFGVDAVDLALTVCGTDHCPESAGIAGRACHCARFMRSAVYVRWSKYCPVVYMSVAETDRQQIECEYKMHVQVPMFKWP